VKPSVPVAIGTAAGFLGGFLLAGVVLLIVRAPQGDAMRLLPADTPAPLRVHVSGAVARPGVVVLAPDSRVEDALAAAGGAQEVADADALNLAALVQDGEHIAVPREGDVPATADVRSPLLPESALSVDINRAGAAELDLLPGVGEVTARSIMTFREKNGPFTSLEQLMDVPGIGPETYEKIKPHITLNP